ncbi:hypothetical protein SLEP1_g48946 [Rubroshorea leprosula]|uniref:Aminotransferase-like plant mobile domain-containing protein n=1 Tax=Rubroshorea leprosula TaxID=152421 RepID=A0AAV5LV89_9ROSI|nr:hypothetical protein SLEP1_g48946 [Rubroshorea leprosula]
MISTVTVLKGDWIADSSNPEEVGQVLRFPSTLIRSSSSSEAKELQLMEKLHQQQAMLDLSPPLLPSNHVTEHATPKAVVTQSIGRGVSKWCQSIDHLGKIPFLSGFWDWSNYTAKMLSRHKMGALADAVSLANNDYCYPTSMLRALIEVWSPSTNTFLTSAREVGISLLEMRDISGLSIRGAYYEEYNRNPPYADPFKSKRYLDMSELKYDGNGNVISVPKLDRPLKWTFGHERKLRGVPEQWDRLGMLDVTLEVNDREKLLIAAYLCVWLGRFVFPDGEEFVRVGTFKAAAQMAIGVTYSLVPPILACIYRGLGQLTKVLDGSWVHATETPPFPGHYLYAWIGLHFPHKTFAARYEASQPMVRQFRGILNAYQPWEPEVADCRAVLRGNLSSDDFCWTPVPLPTHPGPRVDDGQRWADTLDFMVSIRVGYVVFRQEGRFTKKSYNPHRFAKQHGFQQRLPGRHVKLPHGGEVSDLYRFWLSLTQVHSNTFLHIPSVDGGVASRVDPAYVKWWNEEVFPSISTVSIQFLKASKARNFIPSLMKSTVIRPQGKGKQLQALLSPSQKRNNADDPSPSSKKQKCNRSPQREPDSLQHSLSTPAAQQTTRQALYKEIFSSPELRGLPGDEEMIGALDEEMIGALDDFLETDTLEILGSLPSQIDGGVLSLNVGEQGTAEDGEVDSHDRQPSVKEIVGLNPPAMTSSNPLKLKPTFSCITKPLEPISSQALVKPILFKAMSNYVQEEFSRGLQNGFSGLGQWWAERSSAISEALQLYFRMDVGPLLKIMDAYLSKVNLYLAKRDEVSTGLDVEERDKSLATLQKGISSNQIVHDSLSKEINELTKKKGSLESKIESLKKELESVEQQHSDVTSTLDLLLDKRQTAEEQLQSNQAKLIELENSKVIAVETVAEVEKMRQDLESEFEDIAKGTWFENNM